VLFVPSRGIIEAAEKDGVQTLLTNNDAAERQRQHYHLEEITALFAVTMAGLGLAHRSSDAPTLVLCALVGMLPVLERWLQVSRWLSLPVLFAIALGAGIYETRSGHPVRGWCCYILAILLAAVLFFGKRKGESGSLTA